MIIFKFNTSFTEIVKLVKFRIIQHNSVKCTMLMGKGPLESSEGSPEGSLEGSREGIPEGSSEGALRGRPEREP